MSIIFIILMLYITITGIIQIIKGDLVSKQEREKYKENVSKEGLSLYARLSGIGEVIMGIGLILFELKSLKILTSISSVILYPIMGVGFVIVIVSIILIKTRKIK